MKLSIEINDLEKEYMKYLEELYDDEPGYPLLLKKGDPIAFEIGMREWEENRKRWDGFYYD